MMKRFWSSRASNASPRSISALETAKITLRFVPGSGRRMVGIAFTSLASGFAEAFVLVILARAAFVVGKDEPVAIAGGYTLTLDQAIVVAVVVTLLKVALQLLNGVQISAIGTLARRNARRRVLQAYFRASWAKQRSFELGALQNLATNHVDRTSALLMNIAGFINGALSLTVILVTAFAVNIGGAIGLIITGLALFALLRPLTLAVRRTSRTIATASRRLAIGVSESVRVALEARVFGVTDAVLARLDRMQEQELRAFRRSRFLMAIASPTYQSLAILMMLFGLAVIAHVGTTEVGSLGAVVLLLLRGLAYSQQTQASLHSFSEQSGFVKDLDDHLAEFDAAAQPGGHLEVERLGVLALDEVSFEYEPGVRVLRDISIEIAPGEAIGVIGPSGGGKSTLLQILLRLRQPTEGTVTTDGIDVWDITPATWYARTSFVPQDAVLLNASVSDNVRFFREATDDDVERAVTSASLARDIEAWPAHLDTVVGEAGASVSGGQRQRISIARALLQQPDLLVLDEPTSALDGRSEAALQETLRALHGRVTMVIVAHRLSTVQICDRILVLDHGSVQGFDTHENLMRTSPFYEEAIKLATTSAGDAPGAR